jgi:hypothetical protein
VRIVTQQGDVLLLGKHGDPRTRISGADGAEERRDEENVPDGTEANDENVGRWREAVGHGDNVRQKREE